MIKRLLLSIVLLASVAAPTMAAAFSADGCTSQINDRLGREQRLYRRVLFGLERARTAPVGTVRYDTDAVPWLKTDNGTWKTAGEDSDTQSNGEMDNGIERDLLDPSDEATFRLGLFAQKGILTSDLLPAVVQSYRALQCRAASVCEAARMALAGEMKEGAVLTVVSMDGCRTLPIPALDECAPDGDDKTITDASQVLPYCQPVADQLLEREAALLRLSVSYDAAYRSLLQFSGTFDMFLSVFRVDLLRPIEDSQQLLSMLTRIPCFISQCNE